MSEVEEGVLVLMEKETGFVRYRDLAWSFCPRDWSGC